MLSLPDAVRVFVGREPVDTRKGHDGLSQGDRDHFGEDAANKEDVIDADLEVK